MKNVPTLSKDKRAPWHDDFVRNRRRILRHLHLLHPALRQSLSLCKDHLNSITLADFDCYSGEAIDLDSFCGNFISECEKTEETLMNTWLTEIVAIFSGLQEQHQHQQQRQPQSSGGLKGERRLRFYQCASAMLSIQLRDLLMRSVSSFVGIFSDRRRLPRIELELVLRQEKKSPGDDADGGGGHRHRIAFSPSLEEVVDMISSVVTEVRASFCPNHSLSFIVSPTPVQMNKLLREVPTIESYMSDASAEHSFVQVNLDQEFLQMQMARLHGLLRDRLEEPLKYSEELCKDMTNSLGSMTTMFFPTVTIKRDFVRQGR